MKTPSPQSMLVPLLVAFTACAGSERTPADSVSQPTNASAPVPASPAQPAAPQTAAPSVVKLEWKVRADGVRGAIFGRPSATIRMSLAVASAAPFPKGSCEYLDAPTVPVKLMFVSDTLVRVDVRDTSVTTMEGARIGDTEARIKELYAGRVTTTPHKYIGPTGHYLSVSQPFFPENLLVFETDGQRVTTYRMGRKPEVEWVEGCA